MKKFFFIFFISFSCNASFFSEVQKQHIYQYHIDNFVNKRAKDKNNFFKMFSQITNINDLVKLSIIGATLHKNISQQEIDFLWKLKIYSSKKNEFLDFEKIFSYYFLGRQIGNYIIEKYELIDSSNEPVKKFEEVFLEKQIEKSIYDIQKNLTDKKIKNFLFNNNSQYHVFIDKLLSKFFHNPNRISTLKDTFDFDILKKYFDSAFGSQYAIKWIQDYFSDKLNKKISQNKLNKLSVDSLVLAAQTIIASNQDESFSKMIVLYTIASTKDKKIKNKLDFLIKKLIESKKTKPFELFIEEK